jgi:hypothetical protein
LLPEPVPAHRTVGVEALCPVGGASEVVLVTPPALTNVIASPHSSGTAAQRLVASCRLGQETRQAL